MEEPQQSKPGRPPHHFIHLLHIKYSKDEDKFVKDEVPKSVLDLLVKETLELV